MPQMLHVPGVAFTSFGCIGQMNPLVVARHVLEQRPRRAGHHFLPGQAGGQDQHDRKRVTHELSLAISPLS